jgi:alpha-ribazole phosphatase
MLSSAKQSVHPGQVFLLVGTNEITFDRFADHDWTCRSPRTAMIRVRRHTDVWLVRHTQTDWNRERRYQSRSNRPLTRYGALRVDAIAWRLQALALNTIVTTGLDRTDLLATAISAQHRQSIEITCDQRWREADHGDWEGLTYAQVIERYPAQAQQRFADPWHSRAHGGESTAELWTRVEQAWNDLLGWHDGRHLLIVTHATPIQLLLCALLNVPFDRYWQFRIDLGGITNVDLYPSGAIIRTINEIPPLQQEIETR